MVGNKIAILVKSYFDSISPFSEKKGHIKDGPESFMSVSNNKIQNF